LRSHDWRLRLRLLVRLLFPLLVILLVPIVLVLVRPFRRCTRDQENHWSAMKTLEEQVHILYSSHT
jgi:hypothetical protein